jgi:hypothetical protein
MDHAHHDRSRAFLASVQERIRFLQSDITKRYRLAWPSQTVVRRIKAALLLIFAVVVGCIAHRLNDREAELRWKQGHFPSPRIWITSFGSEGFRILSNPSWVAKVSRHLPTLSDVAGRIWRATPDWWAVETADPSAPLIFCLGCDLKKLPENWENRGNGWDGWDLAMQDARQQALDASKQRKKPQIPTEKLDPREIRY